jgi:hypothetical protein
MKFVFKVGHCETANAQFDAASIYCSDPDQSVKW